MLLAVYMLLRKPQVNDTYSYHNIMYFFDVRVYLNPEIANILMKSNVLIVKKLLNYFCIFFFLKF